MKKLCTESPILAYADFKAPLILHTDTSGDGLGAVLYQVQERKQRVIAYASHSLTRSERNYPVHKVDFPALKWAITNKFLEYLYGSQFQVYMDNNPLTYVLTMAKLDATGHRWVAALSNYTISIIYKPGKGHKDTRTKHLLVVPQTYRQRAIEGCHDQVSHLGQDQVLDLLRDQFYWPGMHVDVVSYINSCPRCLHRTSQPDKAPLLNIEASHPLELFHLDYLKIEPSKGNIENFW